MVSMSQLLEIDWNRGFWFTNHGMQAGPTECRVRWGRDMRTAARPTAESIQGMTLATGLALPLLYSPDPGESKVNRKVPLWVGWVFRPEPPVFPLPPVGQGASRRLEVGFKSGRTTGH